jgi:hypothetical protein
MGLVYKLYHMESKTYVTLGKRLTDGDPPHFEESRLAVQFLATRPYGSFEIHNDCSGPCPEHGPEPTSLSEIRPCMEEGNRWTEEVQPTILRRLPQETER